MSSLLDFPQIIKAVYDEAQNRLRVDTGATITIGGELEVSIDAASGDNIKISDGTDTLQVNTDGSINVANLGDLVKVAYDAIAVTYPTLTTEAYAYKTGGLAGTTVATVTVAYTASDKINLLSVVKT